MSRVTGKRGSMFIEDCESSPSVGVVGFILCILRYTYHPRLVEVKLVHGRVLVRGAIHPWLLC